MTADEVIAQVITVMNERSGDDPASLISVDTVELPGTVERVLPNAINALISSLPVSLLKDAKPASTLIKEDYDGYTVIVLPADFARLATVQLAGWKRMVMEAYPSGSEQYNIQFNTFTRAGVNKPVAVFIGGGQLGCFPGGYQNGQGTDVRLFRYVRSAVSKYDVEILESEVHNALCWLCAAMVYEVLGEKELADNLRAVSATLIPSRA
jgi:hypothetical protein